MKNYSRIKYILSIAALTFLSALSQTWARGGAGTGGGDPCDRRFQDIREDLKTWISNGGPQNGLQLPFGISVSEYSSRMNHHIESTFVKCVKPGDKGYPVLVDGEPKVCKFEKQSNSENIICDYDTFLNKTNETEQYKLVHHEYAGLSDFEPPNGPVSAYTISNQITGYLKRVSKLMLDLKPASKKDNQTLKELFDSSTDEINLDEFLPQLRVVKDSVNYYDLPRYKCGSVSANGNETNAAEVILVVRNISSIGPKIPGKTEIKIFPVSLNLNWTVYSFSQLENYWDQNGGLVSWTPTNGSVVGAQTIFKKNGDFITFHAWKTEKKDLTDTNLARSSETYGYCYKE